MNFLRPAFIALLALAAALAVLVLAGFQTRTTRAGPGDVTLVAIDIDTAVNDDSTVGTIEDCGSIPTVGGALTFDLVVKGVDPVDKIMSYQFDIDYDPAVIRIGIDDDGDTLYDEDPADFVDNDADTALDEDPLDFIDVDGAGSTPPDDVTILSRILSTGGAGFLQLSDTQTVGSATFAAADGTNIPPYPAIHESGDGVLARVTITAVGTGTSPLTIPSTLGGMDGFIDTVISAGDGPLSTLPLPITTLQSGEVVVGGSCAGPAATPTPSPTPSPTPTPAPSPTPSPIAIGGIVDIATGSSVQSSSGPKSSARACAGPLVAAVAATVAITLAAGTLYARRRLR